LRAISRFTVLAVGLALAMPAANAHAGESSPDTWQFSITPYLFLPNINGTLKYQLPPGDPEVGLGPHEYLQALNYLLMVSGEARKGDWGVLTDFILLDFADEQSHVKSITGPFGTVHPIDVGTNSSLHGLVWELAGFYGAVNTPKASMDVLAGFRYVKIDTSLAWKLTGSLSMFPQTGNASRDTQPTNAIVGVRGKLHLGLGQWFIPYYFDIGAGSSTTTWQALAGIGYTLRWGDLQLSYRDLFVDQGHDKLVQNLRFSGPTIGVSFRF
jgi:hypothetical protein